MNEWMTLKKQIGELREDSLAHICGWFKQCMHKADNLLLDLGRGNGGEVHKMRHIETGLIMARKLVLLEVKLSTRNQILKELEVLHKCNSPYIVGRFSFERITCLFCL